MIHITYTGWVAIFCFIQLSQLGLILWFVFKKRENKDPIPDLKKLTEELKKDLIKDNMQRTAIILKLFRPDTVIEGEAEKVKL